MPGKMNTVYKLLGDGRAMKMRQVHGLYVISKCW